VTYGVGRAVLGSLAALNVDVAVIGMEPVGAKNNKKKKIDNNDKMKKNVVRKEGKHGWHVRTGRAYFFFHPGNWPSAGKSSSAKPMARTLRGRSKRGKGNSVRTGGRGGGVIGVI
jgi:hypothetical protein